jgi:hypothetical protein
MFSLFKKKPIVREPDYIQYNIDFEKEVNRKNEEMMKFTYNCKVKITNPNAFYYGLVFNVYSRHLGSVYKRYSKWISINTYDHHLRLNGNDLDIHVLYTDVELITEE